MDILHQLGGLILGSVPTMLFFILLVIAYRALVMGPLEKTLAERRARTSGAVEQARGAIAAAEAETTIYEDKLRSARAEIMAERDRRRQQWQVEREAALAEARTVAQQKIQAAKSEIEGTAVAARRQIEDAAAQLSDQILGVLLPSGPTAAEAHS